MPKTVLNLGLTVDERGVATCAAALQQRLPPDQWRLLAALAAEIVARWETTAAGATVLVIPASAATAEVLAACSAAGLPVRE